jgi:hypothetical protein
MPEDAGVDAEIVTHLVERAGAAGPQQVDQADRGTAIRFRKATAAGAGSGRKLREPVDLFNEEIHGFGGPLLVQPVSK